MPELFDTGRADRPPQHESECRNCGGQLTETLTPELPHYGKRVCGECGMHNGWIPKPGSKNRGAKHGDLVRKHSKGFCEMCLRLVSELRPGDLLEAHHVVPYKQGGASERDNLWIVCTPCHRIIEHHRCYYGRKEVALTESVASSLTEWMRDD